MIRVHAGGPVLESESGHVHDILHGQCLHTVQEIMLLLSYRG